MRIFYLIIGWISFGLGVIGAFLPIMPTAPFMILAAICFSKSSEKWHNWLLAQPVVGQMVKDWNDHGVIKQRTKVVSSIFMTPLFFYALFANKIPTFGRVFLAVIAIAVLTFIWTRPSIPKSLENTDHK